MMKQPRSKQTPYQTRQVQEIKQTLVFFDNKNRFCSFLISKIRDLDTKKELTITSIDGKKAQVLFQGNYGFLRRKKSIVFVEGGRVWVRANAVLRLLWNFGGKAKILGALHVIPGFLINPLFRLGTLIVR